MSSFNRSPKRLRLESLREEEIVIPRITEWQFETPEGPEEGEISSARPRSSRPNVDLPARLRPIRWRNVGRDARRGGLWNQVLEFLAWDAENRTSKDGSGVEQSQGSGKEVIEAASNEGEETGEVDGIAAWGEKGSNKLDLGNEKLAPLLCPQSLPSGALSGGAKWRTDKAKGIREDGSEAGSQSGDRPSTVESTHSPNALANPEVANGEGGGAGGAESLEGLNPAEVSGLSAPALKKPIQQSESAAKASQLPPSQTTNGTPEKALKALDQTPTSEHTGPSKPQTLSENGSRERGSGNAAPDTVSRGAEVVEQSQTADVPPCEVVAPQDNNHIEPSKAPGPAEAACPETAENGLQGDAFGHEPGPQRWCVGEEDEAGKMAAPSEGGQQAEALQPGDMPAAGKKLMSPF